MVKVKNTIVCFDYLPLNQILEKPVHQQPGKGDKKYEVSKKRNIINSLQNVRYAECSGKIFKILKKKGILLRINVRDLSDE